MCDIKVLDEDGEYEHELREKAKCMTNDELIEAYVKEGVGAYWRSAYVDTCKTAAFMSLYVNDDLLPTDEEIDAQIQYWWDHT